MKRVLYIGGKGLVGSSFRKLYQDNYEIVIIDKEEKPRMEGFFSGNYDALILSVHSEEAKAPYINAAIFDDHVTTLQKALELGAGKIPTVIYFSTGSVYAPGRENYTVDSPLDLDGKISYGLSKIMAELLLKSFTDHYKSCSILRPFYIYGPGQRKAMLIRGMAERILNGQEITIGSNGGLHFNPVFSEDVARVLGNIIDAPKPGVSIYNIGGSETVTLEEVIHMLGELLGKKPIIKTSDQPASFSIGTMNFPLPDPTSIKDGLKAVVDEISESK